MHTDQKPNRDSSASGMSSILYHIKSVLPLLAVAIPTLLLDRGSKWLVQRYNRLGDRLFGYPRFSSICGTIQTQVLPSVYYQGSAPCSSALQLSR